MFRLRSGHDNSGRFPASLLSSHPEGRSTGQSMHLMNAASFSDEGKVSPDMIVAVFGANLTASTASAVSGAAPSDVIGRHNAHHQRYTGAAHLRVAHPGQCDRRARHPAWRRQRGPDFAHRNFHDSRHRE